MKRDAAEQAVFERQLKSADPAPATPALVEETMQAMARTRAAISAARGGKTAWNPSSPVVAAFTVIPAPWGPLHVAASGSGIVEIELASETAGFVDRLAVRLAGRVVPEEDAGVPVEWRGHLAAARRQLAEYFAGTRSSFDLPVDLRGVSDWDRRVLMGAAGLVFGQVTSYGELARRIGKPGAARAVGGALGRNPIPIVIPCHRILAAGGRIGGYGGGGHGHRPPMLSVKRTLLSLEGCQVAG